MVPSGKSPAITCIRRTYNLRWFDQIKYVLLLNAHFILFWQKKDMLMQMIERRITYKDFSLLFSVSNVSAFWLRLDSRLKSTQENLGSISETWNVREIQII
jgi:hypothetical protein